MPITKEFTYETVGAGGKREKGKIEASNETAAAVQLRAHGRIDVRVAVTVHVAPQRRHAVDVAAAIRVDQPHPLGRLDRRGGLAVEALHLGEPEHRAMVASPKVGTPASRPPS